MENVKGNLVKVLLIVNLVLGVISIGGVGYLVYKQASTPNMSEMMGGRNGMTPPNGGFQNQQGNAQNQGDSQTSAQ